MMLSPSDTVHSPIQGMTRTGGAVRLEWATVAIILLAAGLALRCAQFGNPLIHVDESFYLLTGDRMLKGALLYVDIWDRKPVGLFAIFAAIRLLGGDGILQYQIVATLFATATAWIIARIAAPMAGRWPATVAGVIYLMLLGLVGGSGGQAPVFYNLFVAGAAWATLTALRPSTTPARVRRLGAVAMALVGLGMQVKYTVVFEGLFLGVMLLGASWRASRQPDRLIADALLWVGLAIAPTAAAWAYYVAIGHGQAFLYANFLSIGDRSAATPAELGKRLAKAWRALHVPVFLVILAVSLQPWRRFERGPQTFFFVLAWLGAAVGGYLVFGTYFDHYALPLFVPLATAAAPVFAMPRRLTAIATAGLVLLTGGIANAVVIHKTHLKRGDAAHMQRIVAAIRPHLSGCLYVWDGSPLLYQLTGSCLPTHYPFAGHLNLKRENGAIGVDQMTEVRRILAGRPSVIVDHEPTAPDFNFAVTAVVKSELRRHYRRVETVPFAGSRTVIYERRAGE